MRLRTSEEQYRALYEDNPFMYFTLDARGTILSVNRYGAEQLGFSVEELLGRPVLDVFHEEDKEGVSRRLDECLLESGQTYGWEARKVRKDGSTLWVRETVRAVRSPGGDTFVLVVCEDITERKLAEVALQESNSRTRNILESITDAFFALDSEWRFTYVNSEAERVLQRPREELLGENVWEKFPEAVGSTFYREYHKALQERRPSSSRNTIRRSRPGSVSAPTRQSTVCPSTSETSPSAGRPRSGCCFKPSCSNR